MIVARAKLAVPGDREVRGRFQQTRDHGTSDGSCQFGAFNRPYWQHGDRDSGPDVVSFSRTMPPVETADSDATITRCSLGRALYPIGEKIDLVDVGAFAALEPFCGHLDGGQVGAR